MNTQLTSVKAYLEEQPKMPTQKGRILELIAKASYPVTREMLEQWTGLKHNIITARLHALVNEEVMIREHKPAVSSTTGKDVITYTTFKTPTERREQIYQFRREADRKLNDLIADYQDGNLHGYTYEMVLAEKTRIERYIKKLDRLS